ncbi:MAG: hypothetical protein WC457_02300 [Patescibacteria group bacterium]
MTTRINTEKLDESNTLLEILIDECRRHELPKFQEGEGRTIIRAFHVPYSGSSRPDYVDFFDYLEEDARILVMELYDRGKADRTGDIMTLEELKAEWETVDDDGLLHDLVDRSLTWQQGLRECEIILDNCEEVETDSGLWEKLEPTEAIRSQAFFTYKNEVRRRGLALIEEKIKDEHEFTNENDWVFA